MTTQSNEGRGAIVPPSVDVPADVVEAATSESAGSGSPKPAWVDRFVWSSLVKVVAIALLTFLLLAMAWQTRHLLGLIVVATFFSLALIPAVNVMHAKYGWRRGAAVGVIYAGAVLFVVAMVLVLIPAIVEFANRVRGSGSDWAAELNSFAEDTLGVTVLESGAVDEAAATAEEALAGWAEEILGFASTGIGLIFDLSTIAMFTFYLTADYPRIERALMKRMPPDRQRVYGWVSDESIEQTGGYFYSRLVLAFILGSLSFVVMLLVGLPTVFALPLAVFMGFVSTFIPAIGTYIGAALPLLVVLAVQGLVPALILLGFVLIYQQLENMWLSPRISADTMELNGAIAFGAALAGGAIAGPMGAFMALPVAALITAVIKNSGKTYDVVYQLKYDSDGPAPSAQISGTPTRA